MLVVHKPVGPTLARRRRSARAGRSASAGSATPARSIRRRRACCRSSLGQATRLAQHLTASDKEYEATVRFGVVTDTYDAAGEVVGASPAPCPTRADARGGAAAVSRARSSRRRRSTPRRWSAASASYVRARAGKPVQAAGGAVTAHALELLELRRAAGARARPLLRRLLRPLAGARPRRRRSGRGAILDALVRTEAAGFAHRATRCRSRRS